MDLNNTVIEVLNRTHGKKVEQFFKDAGHAAEASRFYFTNTKEAGNNSRFYGFINGNFNDHHEDNIKREGVVVLKLPESIKVNRDALIVAYNEYSCSEWTGAIRKILTDNILVQDDDIEVGSYYVMLLTESGTDSQKRYAMNVFGLKLPYTISISRTGDVFYDGVEILLHVAATGDYEGKAFSLSSQYDWKLEGGTDTVLRLIPTKKVKE